MTSCIRASRALDNPAVLIACILRSASSGWGFSEVPAHPFLQVLRTCSFHDPRTFLLPSLPWVLFEHAEPQIGSRRGREDPPEFQFQLLIGSRLEKAQPFPKEDRDNAHVDFVNQPGSQALLSGLRAAYHRDLFVPCGGFCLLNRTVDALGN